MPLTIYGDGSKYGDADAIYGRISAELAVAQDASVRQTALQVIIKDYQLNSWEHHAGTNTYSDDLLSTKLYRAFDNTNPAYVKEYWAYRGGTAITKLGNGNFVRLRLGDPTSGSDRQIWIQTITAPGTPSQWTSGWSVLYSGSHYGVDVRSDGTASGYHVYHTKDDGVYRDNVKRWDDSVFAGPHYAPEAISCSMVGGTFDMGWIQVIHRSRYDDHRVIQTWWCDDFAAGSPVYEDFSFAWLRNGIGGYKISDTQVGFMFAAPLYTSPRSELQGSVVAVGFKTITGNVNTPLYPIRGVGAGSGISYMFPSDIVQLADGYYYCFGSEIHIDAMKRPPGLGISSSLGKTIPVWMRSKDFKHWAEPVVGPGAVNSGGFGGVVESGDFLYWSDFETVFRRPTDLIEYDISNYIPKIDFDLPRDNQPGLGTALIANPAGVNDYLEELSDKEMTVRVGLNTSVGYQYGEFDQFFMKRTTRETKGAANRLTLEFGNVWDRLDNQFKDVHNFIGRFTWDDFKVNARNQPFNYFFASDSNPQVVGTNRRLRTRGIVLLTAWKGHNPDISAQFSGMNGNPRLIARYKDSRNYWYLEKVGTSLDLYHVIDGDVVGIDSWGSGSGVTSDTTPKMRLRLRWNRYDVWLNNVFIGGDFLYDTTGFAGYAGFSSSAGTYDVGYVHVEDYEQDITMADLIKTALAMGDFHETLVDETISSRAYAIIWGPRTDIPTIADALRTSLEVEKSELIYRNGSVIVGKFNDTTEMKVIEDTVVESDQIEEANRRLNFAQVDGNDRFWIEVDTEDVNRRARLLVSYVDIPELVDRDAIIERAREEIRRSALGSSPGGMTPLYFDLSRMDTVRWIDNLGNEKLVRIEGFSVDIDQGARPHQRQQFDLSEYVVGSDGSLVIPETENE